MSRPSNMGHLYRAEIHQLLQLLDEAVEGPQQRRAHAILLHHEGMPATEIAATLGVHVNTIYTDWHAFAQQGLRAVQQVGRRGAPGRLTVEQTAGICRLADRPPYELGLPYGRWSLAKLRTYLMRKHIVKKISRTQLWRILKKGAWGSGGYAGSCSVAILAGQGFWPKSAGYGGIYRPREL
jgi:transposase